MKLLIVLSIFFSAASFAGNRESGGRVGASAVYIDFKSFGTGIDSATKETFEILLRAAKARGEVVDETVELKGREGETINCVQLSNASQRYNFIQPIAYSILMDTQNSGIKRTSVYVGMDCHSFDSATEQDLSKY
ncbi:MAG: hypothetical protein Q7U04_05845 [Bacteriovorax sp.]|nr:hypothetical protein [Bacteriovorax sp.]